MRTPCAENSESPISSSPRMISPEQAWPRNRGRSIAAEYWTPVLLPAGGARSAAVLPQMPGNAVAFAWLTRTRRVLLALLSVWVLNVFDLCFTLRESQYQHFIELNPIAAHLLGGPDHWVIIYKLALLLVGSTILLALRQHSVAELASWFLMAVSVYVGTRWYVYFQCLVDDKYSPFVTAFIGS